MANLSGTEFGILLLSFANILLIILLGVVLGWIYLRGLVNPKQPEQPSATATPNPADTAANAQDEEATQNTNLLLCDMLADLQEHCIAPIDSALSESFELVTSIDGLDATQYPQWQADHQEQLQSLLERRKELEFQVDDLKGKLDRAHKLVTTLHGQNRKLGCNEKKLTQLQVQQQHLQEEMAELRKQRSKASEDLQTSKRDLRDARLKLTEDREQHAAEQLALEKRRDQLEKETALLRTQLEREREVLVRTMVEKEFIETEFIGADAATDELRRIKAEYQKLKDQLAPKA